MPTCDNFMLATATRNSLTKTSSKSLSTSFFGLLNEKFHIVFSMTFFLKHSLTKKLQNNLEPILVTR